MVLGSDSSGLLKWERAYECLMMLGVESVGYEARFDGRAFLCVKPNQ